MSRDAPAGGTAEAVEVPVPSGRVVERTRPTSLNRNGSRWECTAVGRIYVPTDFDPEQLKPPVHGIEDFRC